MPGRREVQQANGRIPERTANARGFNTRGVPHILCNELYASRPSEGAYCFRKGAGINTNMRLESMFGLFKYGYMDGKQKRLDTLAHVLMQLTCDKLFSRRTKVINRKICASTTAVYQAHQTAVEICSDDIMEVRGVWTFLSQTTKGDVYTVTRSITCEGVMPGDVNERSQRGLCVLRCRGCGICPHSYAYTGPHHFFSGNM